MPTTNTFAGTADSITGQGQVVSWAEARRNATTSGNYHNNSLSSYNFGVYNIYSSARGGNRFACRRSYFPFDLSGGSGTCTAATVIIYLDNLGSTGNPSRVILVAATALDGSTADHGNCFSSGTTLGTSYSDVVSASATAGYHTFTMTSDAITDINSALGSGTLTMALLGYDFDHQNTAPSLDGDYTRISIRYANYSGTLSDPYISVVTEAAVTDNATFFGTNF